MVDAIQEARRLRKAGHSLGEICSILSRSKSTVYSWIKELPVPEVDGVTIRKRAQQEWQRKGCRDTQKRHRIAREAAHRKGWEEAPVILRDPLMRDFVVLYLGEGTRKGDNQLCVTNTDPALLSLAWWGIQKTTSKSITVRVFCREYERSAVTSFWSLHFGVSPEGIKIVLKKGPEGKNRAAYGVVQLVAYDTLAKARLRGWMDWLKAQWGDSSNG